MLYLKIIFLLEAIVLFFALNLSAQSKASSKPFLFSNKFSILSGLMQPLVLKGGNVEINYFTKRMSFDYSHGFSLSPPVVGDYKQQSLGVHIPITTGFGIGYRITQFFDIRVEPKLHSWELYYDGDKQSGTNSIKKFNTYTLGFGAYYRYFPFINNTNKLLQGITTSTSLRYWPNVSSTLNNNKWSYLNKATNKSEILAAPNIGIANTPMVFNIAVGYTFGGK
jgi:hypothetical protein